MLLNKMNDNLSLICWGQKYHKKQQQNEVKTRAARLLEVGGTLSDTNKRASSKLIFSIQDITDGVQLDTDRSYWWMQLKFMKNINSVFAASMLKYMMNEENTCGLHQLYLTPHFGMSATSSRLLLSVNVCE